MDKAPGGVSKWIFEVVFWGGFEVVFTTLWQLFGCFAVFGYVYVFSEVYAVCAQRTRRASPQLSQKPLRVTKKDPP